MTPRADGTDSRQAIALALPWLATLAIVLFGVTALPQVNVTWDEALSDFFFGQRYLSFFTSFDPAYLDFEHDPYPPGHVPDLSSSANVGRPWEVYPVANTLAAATSILTHRWLGISDPFDGFHAVNLAYAALLVFVMCAFVRRHFGLLTAGVAVALLFTSPRVIAHMLANIKDFPSIVMFSITSIAFLAAWQRGSARWLLAVAALLGLAIGTKANALFFVPVAAVVWLAGGTPEAWRGRRAVLFATLAGSAVVALTVLVASWPYLWAEPIRRLALHLHYIGLRAGYTSAESIAPVLQAIVLTTPPVLLIAFVLGLPLTVAAAWRRQPAAILLLAWVGVTLGRHLLPQAVNFDGVRHFLELFPAMAIIGAIGITGWSRRLLSAASTSTGMRWRVAIAVLALLPGAWATLVSHPFQLAYWNTFAGGLSGARDADLPQASDYWGTSYRLGMRWLNEHAPPDALIAVPVVEHAVRLVAPSRLRPDLQLLPLTSPFTPRIPPERFELLQQVAAERPVLVMFVERRDWMNVLMADCLTRLDPIAEWQLHGAPVLRIYHYRPPTRPSAEPPTP